MRLTIQTIILFLSFALFSCGGNEYIEDVELTGLALPIEISQDITEINLSKYLHEEIKLISVKTDKELTHTLIKDSTYVILNARNLISPISNIHIKTNKGRFDILIKNTRFKRKSNLSPQIYGNTFDHNIIHFSIKNRYNKIFAYVNNRRLKKKSIIYEEGQFSIEVPEKIENYNNSYIRIYASDSLSGVSNEFLVPIKNGEAITNFQKLDTTNLKNKLYSELYDDKEYFQLYKDALNTFVYRKNNCTYLDSSLRKSIKHYGLYRITNPKTRDKRYLPLYDHFAYADKEVSQRLTKYKKPRSFNRSHKGVNQLNAFLMTIPGPPSYYIKPNKLDKHLSDHEFSFLKIEALRETSLSLIYGNYISLRQDVLTYAYLRKYFDDFTIMIFNRSKFMKKRKIDLPSYITEANGIALFNSKYDITKGKLIIELQPHSVEIITGKIAQ